MIYKYATFWDSKQHIIKVRLVRDPRDIVKTVQTLCGSHMRILDDEDELIRFDELKSEYECLDDLCHSCQKIRSNIIN